MSVDSQKRFRICIVCFALQIPALGVCWWFDLDYILSLLPSICVPAFLIYILIKDRE